MPWWRYTVEIPALADVVRAIREGAQTMAVSLDGLTQAINNLNAAIDQELTELKEALEQASGGNQAELQEALHAAVRQIEETQQRIHGMVP